MPVLDATDITAVTNAVLAAMNATPPNVNLVTVLGETPTIASEPIDTNLVTILGETPSLLTEPISVDVNAIITAFNANPPNTVLIDSSGNIEIQDIKTEVRQAINGRWADEIGNYFNLTVTDIP